MIERLKSIAPIPKLLFGLSAALTGVLVVEIALLGLFAAADDSAGPDAGPATSYRPDTSNTTLTIPPIVQFREVIERPLFIEGRRPPKTQSSRTSSVEAVQLNGKWKVTGIFLAGEQSFVHVESVRDKKTTRLKAGAMLDGWRVASIEQNIVRFSNGAQSASLELQKKSPR